MSKTGYRIDFYGRVIDGNARDIADESELAPTWAQLREAVKDAKARAKSQGAKTRFVILTGKSVRFEVKKGTLWEVLGSWRHGDDVVVPPYDENDEGVRMYIEAGEAMGDVTVVLEA